MHGLFAVHTCTRTCAPLQFCAYTISRLCIHNVQRVRNVYAQNSACVYTSGSLCMATEFFCVCPLLLAPSLQFCVYTIPILCVRNVKTARNVYAQHAICVRDVQFVYTRIIICVWPQKFFVYVHRHFCGHGTEIP